MANESSQVSRRPEDTAPPPPPEILFSEEAIAARVSEMAKEIAAAPVRPAIAMPILVGGFVFAADLVRALGRQEVPMEIEMLWLRSYGDKRVASAVSMIAGPSEDVIAGRDVLIIDGVLDMGRTVKKATQLILAAGAASVQVAVILDKQRPDAVAKADFRGFTVGNDFVIGYGMDDAGKFRGLPYIGVVRG
jgi:hypoxanthine phosphoribosyltransferase